MTKEEIYQEALSKAVNGQSVANYAAIFEGFSAKGIPMEDIRPRANVFTWAGWKALGYHVRKGEHGVKVVTVIKATRKNKKTGEDETHAYPWTTTVFHASQVESDNEQSRPVDSPVEMSATA